MESGYPPPEYVTQLYPAEAPLPSPEPTPSPEQKPLGYPILNGSIWEHKKAPIEPAEIQQMYTDGIRMLGNFVNGYRSGNAEQMGEATSQLADMVRDMHIKKSQVSLAQHA